jgi:hypothetical protein
MSIPSLTGRPAALPDRTPAGTTSGGEFTDRNRTDGFEDLSQHWQSGHLHPTGGYDDVLMDPATGITRYTLDDDPHRLDGPAVIYADGTEEFYFEGARHRAGGLPAVIMSTGELEYYVKDELHRDGDLPALVTPDGDREYWVRGKRSREGGNPAIVRVDGRTEWWLNGQRNRPIAEGPALIRADGSVSYFEFGREIHPRKGNPRSDA